MNLLLDMNIPEIWVPFLAGAKIEAEISPRAA